MYTVFQLENRIQYKHFRVNFLDFEQKKAFEIPKLMTGLAPINQFQPSQTQVYNPPLQ